jgi:hypothetical protein
MVPLAAQVDGGQSGGFSSTLGHCALALPSTHEHVQAASAAEAPDRNRAVMTKIARMGQLSRLIAAK